MRAVELIMKKRDGGAFTDAEIAFLVQGFTRGEIPDYQFAALLMAIVLKGMTPGETAALTGAMIASGEVLDLSGVPGPLVDKHSTGGVGDKISLVLAPLAAACGLRVPMMSGRSLGHTGGTLDKLEAIPGFRTDLSHERFVRALNEVGFAMIGQSEAVVPADRKMYALRDVTGTVESIPLITASIMSKKFAEGAQALVFDVKCGSGAFMKTRGDARALADSLVRTGQGLGRKVVAVLSDMDQPLGRKIGNFLEVEEIIDCLRGRGPADVVDLTIRLVAWMLVAGGICPTAAAGRGTRPGPARRRLGVEAFPEERGVPGRGRAVHPGAVTGSAGARGAGAGVPLRRRGPKDRRLEGRDRLGRRGRGALAQGRPRVPRGRRDPSESPA